MDLPVSPQIGELYGNDELGLELALEFWCQHEPGQPVLTHSGFASMYSYKAPQRQVSDDALLRQQTRPLSSASQPILRVEPGVT